MKSIMKSVTIAGIAAMVAAVPTSCNSSLFNSTQETQVYTNQDFYTNGKFDTAKAKQAYFDMMTRFGYDYKGMLKTETNPDLFWVLDFSLNDFAKVGMGGVFFANHNHPGGGYLAHDIYLLPGQMIPEHAHVDVPGVCPPKRESWQVRNGSAYSFSVQDDVKDQKPAPAEANLPASQIGKGITCNSWKLLGVGDVDTLNKDGYKHFLIAGPEGCIVTETATFHSMDGLRFTNPNVKL